MKGVEPLTLRFWGAYVFLLRHMPLMPTVGVEPTQLLKSEFSSSA